MVSVQDDVLDPLNLHIKFQLDNPVHALVFFLLGSFVLVQNLAEDFAGAGQVTEVEDLVGVNVEVFFKALCDIFIDDEEGLVHHVVFGEGLLHFEQAFHDL